MKVIEAAQELLRARPGVSHPDMGLPCCEAVARILRLSADMEPVEELRDGGPWWRDMMIQDPLKPWSNIVPAWEWFGAHDGPWFIEPKGDFSAIRARIIPGRWHDIQGWSSLPSPAAGHSGSGHNFLAYAVTQDEWHVLQSSIRGGLEIPDMVRASSAQSKLKRYVGGVGIVPLILE